MWDGMDDVGRKSLVEGSYTWKALTSQVVAVDEGGIGDSVYSTDYFDELGHSPDLSYALRNVAWTPAAISMSSQLVENTNGFQKYNQDGQLLRKYGADDGVGGASDGTYVYFT